MLGLEFGEGGLLVRLERVWVCCLHVSSDKKMEVAHTCPPETIVPEGQNGQTNTYANTAKQYTAKRYTAKQYTAEQLNKWASPDGQTGEQQGGGGTLAAAGLTRGWAMCQGKCARRATHRCSAWTRVLQVLNPVSHAG